MYCVLLSDACVHTKLRVTAERDLFASLLCSICIVYYVCVSGGGGGGGILLNGAALKWRGS